MSKLNRLQPVSVHDIAIVSDVTGQTSTSLVNEAVGLVLSSLYVPPRVDEFDAESVAHKYNTWDHSVLCVMTVELVKLVQAEQSGLFHLYLAVLKLVSETDNMIGISEFFHVVELLFAFNTGLVISFT